MQRTNRGLMGAVGKKGKWVVGIEEGSCWDEPWVLSISDEPRESTPKPRAHYTHCMLAKLTINSIKKMKARGWRKIYHVKRKNSDTFLDKRVFKTKTVGHLGASVI